MIYNISIVLSKPAFLAFLGNSAFSRNYPLYAPFGQKDLSMFELKLCDRVSYWGNMFALVSMVLATIIMTIGSSYMKDLAQYLSNGALLAAVGVWDPPQTTRGAWMHPLMFSMMSVAMAIPAQMYWASFNFRYPERLEDDNRPRLQWIFSFFSITLAIMTGACMDTRYLAW